MHANFSQYLEHYKLISIAQSGFRKLHSTVIALLNVTDKWLKNIYRGLVTGVVFIDLHKAFKTVDVNILLSKLSIFGISGVEHRWVQSYLTDRSQSVMFDGHLSDPLPVNIDVPQRINTWPLTLLTLPKWSSHHSSGLFCKYVCRWHRHRKSV